MTLLNVAHYPTLRNQGGGIYSEMANKILSKIKPKLTKSEQQQDTTTTISNRWVPKHTVPLITKPTNLVSTFEWDDEDDDLEIEKQVATTPNVIISPSSSSSSSSPQRPYGFF